MAVSNTTTLVQYVGNNSAVTPYVITFPFEANSWIKCQLLEADGTVTDLILDTDYTVTGAGGATGNLVTAIAYDNTHQLTIYREVPLTQALDLVYNDRLPAQLLEDALDKLTYISQQLSTLGDPGQKTLKFPISEPTGNDDTLPVPALRLGKYLYFDATTGEISLTEATDGLTADGTTLLDTAGVLSVKNNGVSNAKLAQVATAIIKGRLTASTGDVEDISLADLLAALTPLGTGINLSTSQATTAGFAFDFAGLPSWLNRITVTISNVSIDSANDNLIFQLGDAGGVEETGYVGNSTMIAGGTAITSAVTTGAATIDTASLAASTWSGKVIFDRQDGNTWAWNGIICNTTASVRTHILSGYKTLSATLDRIRMTCNPSNEFDLGTINISYE